MKDYYIYAVYSDKHKQIYIGHTDNLQRRINQHNIGKVKSTKPYKPYKLIYTETISTKAEAVKREKQLKQANGRRFLKKFI